MCMHADIHVYREMCLYLSISDMYPSMIIKIVKAENSKTFLQTEDPEEQVAEFSLSSKTHSQSRDF